MVKINFKFTFLLICIALLCSGCISFNSKSNQAPPPVDNGIFKSADQGNSWQHTVLVPTISGAPGSIGNLSAGSLAMDPSDSEAVYFGSVGNGMFFSYDGGVTWQPAHNLGIGTIQAIAVDPNAKCIIYTAIQNTVFRSIDCSRNWDRAYYDNDLNVKINTIAIDHYDSERVYIGTSRGEVIKSYDKGITWQTLNRLNNNIEKIIVSPHDSRKIFVATTNKGVYRSDTGGTSWVDLSENLKEFLGNTTFRDIVASEAEPGLLYLATNYGLISSGDDGDTWVKIELITPEQNAVINSIATSPVNPEEIYYITNTTFYRSLDRGTTWSTIKLPTTKTGHRIIIDQENPNIIYLAVK